MAELVRAVCDANNAFDLEEERFLVALVLALSLAPEDVADLVVHAADGIDGAAKRAFDVLFAAPVIGVGWPIGAGDRARRATELARPRVLQAAALRARRRGDPRLEVSHDERDARTASASARRAAPIPA